MDELEKYYQYLKSNGADVPSNYNSFRTTLSDSATANQYYNYLKKNKFDVPDNFDSFRKTFNIGYDSQEVKQQKQPAIPGFMDIGSQTQQTIQTAQQKVPKVQQQEQPKLQGGARDIMAGFGVRSDLTPNQEQQQYLQSSVEATKVLQEQNKKQAVQNTAALYFENNPIELKGIGIDKGKQKTGLAAAGKEAGKFSLQQLQSASPFNKKVAELQSKLDSGELTVYPANNGELRLAYKADGLTNYIEGLKDAYYAKGKAEKILSMDFDEFKKFVEESKVDDKAYLPEKADQQSTLYGFGQASLMAGKGAAGAAIGSVLAAGAPTTGGLSTAGLPAVMAWAATVPDMATQMQAFSLVDYYNRAKQENPLISDREAFEMAKNQSRAAYVEQLATGTVMAATGFASLPANTGQGLWKAVGQFAKNQPRALGETGLAVGAGSVSRDLAARQFGFNVTDQEIYDNAYNQIRQEITEDLAFNIGIGSIHAPGYVKAQAKGVLSKMPPEKLEQALQAAVQQGTITEEQAVKTAQGLAEFKAAESKVPETLPEEKRNAIAGLIEQRTKIEAEQKEALARLDPIFHEEVKQEYDNQLKAVNEKIKKIKDADDIFEFEQDNLTGQKANVLDENQLPVAPEEISQPIELEVETEIQQQPTPQVETAIPVSEQKQLDLENRFQKPFISGNRTIKQLQTDSGNKLKFIDLGDGLVAWVIPKDEKTTIQQYYIADVNGKSNSVHQLVQNEKGKFSRLNEPNIKDDARAFGEDYDKKISRFNDAKERLSKLMTTQVVAEETITPNEQEIELGGGVKNNSKDADYVLPISDINNLRSQRKTNLATGNAIELESNISKNGLKEALVITYYPNEGKASLTDGHTRLDVATDMGATKMPVRIVERYTDAPASAKDWTPPNQQEITVSKEPLPIERQTTVSESEATPITETPKVESKEVTTQQPDITNEINKQIKQSQKWEQEMSNALDEYSNPKNEAQEKEATKKINKIREERRKRDIELFKNNIEDENYNEVHDAILTGEDGVSQIPKGYTATVIDSYYEPILGRNHTIVSVKNNKGQTFYIDVNTYRTVEIGKVYDSKITEPTTTQPIVEEVKSDLGTKARDLAAKVRSGEKQVLPDWLQASLPKGTKKQGIDINEAFAKALETFADIYDTTKDFAQAVEEGFKNIKDWFDENKIPYNEAELKAQFAKDRQAATEETQTPPTPPIPPVSEGEGGKVVYKMRSLQKNLINRSTALTAEQKALVKTNPEAMYEVLPMAVSKKIALEIIKELGVEEAVREASLESTTMTPVERAMVLGAAMDYYAGEAQKAKSISAEKRNADLEIEAKEKFDKVVEKLGKLGTAYGQAINIFKGIYKLSNIALARKIEKRTQRLKELNAPEADKQVEEVITIINNEQEQVKNIGKEMTDEMAKREASLKEEIAALQKEIADLKKQIQEDTGKPKGSKENPLKIKRKTDDTEYDRRLKEFRQRNRTGLNKDDLSDLTYFGMYHLENGLVKFADWYNAMAKKFGKFKEHLPDIYDRVKEDALNRGADDAVFSNQNEVSDFFSGVKAKDEYKTLETERNRQLALVEKLKEKLAKLEKEGLPKKEISETEKDVPEIEALKQQVSDLQNALRKKESDVKKTEDKITKLKEELNRIRERRKKEPKKTAQQEKQYSEEEKAIIEEIKSEQEKWNNEKKAAAQAKRDYAKMETERNRQMKRLEELNKKLESLKQGKRPETETKEPVKDTPEIENVKAQIKLESEKLSNIEKQQKRIQDLETELQRLKDRKPKEEKETTTREISDREKELREQIEAEKEKIRQEYKQSPEYKAESDAKKMAQLTKRKAKAEFDKAMQNNPDRARVLAPRIAAKRIRRDAANSLDNPTTKNEQTYLKKLVSVVVNKAKEYYADKKEKVDDVNDWLQFAIANGKKDYKIWENTQEYYADKKEKVDNVNDWLQFAIANGKKDYKIWENTQEEVKRQIDADERLNDTEKAEVKEFLDEYVNSVFEILLTETQQRKIINQKLIDNGFGAQRTVKGKIVNVVDWEKVIGSPKNKAEAKAAIVKAIKDLGFTEAEAKNEINALLDMLDGIIVDKITAQTNKVLNKGLLTKAKSLVTGGVGRTKIQKLVGLKDKGILDAKGVREALSEQLGIHELSEKDYNKIKQLLAQLNTPNLPVFVKKGIEEEVQYLFDKYGGNMMYLKHREFGLSNQLGSIATFIQNLSGLNRVPSKILVTAIKTGNLSQVLSIAGKEIKKAFQVAKTVAFTGDVSRGTAFDDFIMSLDGNPKVRYTEYGENKLLGMPDVYVDIAGKPRNVNLFNQGMTATSRVVNRGMEAADTFASNPIAALDIYENIIRELKVLHPEYSSKKRSQMAYDLMYGEDIAAAKAEALQAMRAIGMEPTEAQLNRAAYEAVERKINEKFAKDFYEVLESKKPDAKKRLEDRGIQSPTEEQITNEAYLILGRDEPMDIIASGEREAQRLTGKQTPIGITWAVLSPIEILQRNLRRTVTKEHGLAGKITYNSIDAATQVLAPFISSIGRWIEFGIELTPYGTAKGIVYKMASKPFGRIMNIPASEVQKMGTDFIYRGIQGTAQTMLGFWLLALLSDEDKEPEELVTGTYQEENYNKEKVERAGKPKRTININGYNLPLDLAGPAGIPYMMFSDFMKRRKSPDFDEKHGIFYTTIAVYFDQITQSYANIDQRYGGLLTSIQQGKSDKAGQSIGTIVGQTAGKYMIPFNRTQADIAQLWNPESKQSIDFGTNALMQLSIVRGFDIGKPNFDYRGRVMDVGDMYAMSVDGMRKMFQKNEKADDIDEFLGKIDFAATDAYRESKSEETYKYTIVRENGKSDFMTPEEYYTFKFETAKIFDDLLIKNTDKIKEVEIDDVIIKKEKQREIMSKMLTEAKEQSLEKLQKNMPYKGKVKSMEREEEKQKDLIDREIEKLKLEGFRKK